MFSISVAHIYTQIYTRRSDFFKERKKFNMQIKDENNDVKKSLLSSVHRLSFLVFFCVFRNIIEKSKSKKSFNFGCIIERREKKKNVRNRLEE